MYGAESTLFKFGTSLGLRNAFKPIMKPNRLLKYRFYSSLWNISSIPSAKSKIIATPWKSLGYKRQFTDSLDQFSSKNERTSELILCGIEGIPSKIDDFKVKLNDAEVTLTKILSHDESIVVKFNAVNYSTKKKDIGYCISRLYRDMYFRWKSSLQGFGIIPEPRFTIYLKKGDLTVVLMYSQKYKLSKLNENSININCESLVIDKVYSYRGGYQKLGNKALKIDTSAYHCSYSSNMVTPCPLMEIEKQLQNIGLCNNFMNEMAKLRLAYEHNRYLNFLENLEAFTSQVLTTYKKNHRQMIFVTTSAKSLRERNWHSKYVEEKSTTEYFQNDIYLKFNNRYKTIPTHVHLFKAEFDDAEVILTKKDYKGETVTIKFSTNGSNVQNKIYPEEYYAYSTDTEEWLGNDVRVVTSRPKFKIEIKKGDITMGFVCQCIREFDMKTWYDIKNRNGDDDYLFETEKMYSYKGESTDSVYMKDIETTSPFERKIRRFLRDNVLSNEFVHKMVEFSTVYDVIAKHKVLKDLQQIWRVNK